MRSRYRWFPALALGLCTGVLGAGQASAIPGTSPSPASATQAAATAKAQGRWETPAPSASSTVAGAGEPTAPSSPSAPSVSAEPTGPTASPTSSDGPSLSEEEQYWTADRMDNAVPVDAAPDPASASQHALAAALRPPPDGTPDSEHFGGHPMVGTFFFDGRPLTSRKTYCTGSVVHTAAKDIVLTAGHCGIGMESATHRIFVPQYRSGKSAAEQLHGIFPV